MQQQIHYRPVAMEFLTADTLDELAAKVTSALESDKLLHGDWKITEGKFVQAVAKADWRPVPPPKQQSNLVTPPERGSILG